MKQLKCWSLLIVTTLICQGLFAQHHLEIKTDLLGPLDNTLSFSLERSTTATQSLEAEIGVGSRILHITEPTSFTHHNFNQTLGKVSLSYRFYLNRKQYQSGFFLAPQLGTQFVIHRDEAYETLHLKVHRTSPLIDENNMYAGALGGFKWRLMNWSVEPLLNLKFGVHPKAESFYSDLTLALRVGYIFRHFARNAELQVSG